MYAPINLISGCWSRAFLRGHTLIGEQDILGDRLVRRKTKRRDADAFLAELQALSVGDLIDGYSEDLAKLTSDWDAFDARAEQASAPVFRMPKGCSRQNRDE